MNLLDDLIEWQAEALRNEGVAFDESKMHKDPVVFLANCLEFDRRRISAQPRKVEYSRELQQSAAFSVHGNAIQILAARATAGETLTPFQTKLLGSFDKRDLLLSDWGIHHLHLGHLRPGALSCGRTSDLLFAVFEDGIAYFIDVMDHHAFSEKRLLEILDANWPEHTGRFVGQGIVGLEYEPTSEEIGELRKAGVNSLVSLRPGRVSGPPGGGVTTAGTSVRCMMEANRMGRLLSDAEDVVRSNETAIRMKLGIDDSVPLRLYAMLPDAVQIYGEGKPGIAYSITIRS